MTSLAVSVSLVSRTRKGFPLTDQFLSQIRELLVIDKVCGYYCSIRVIVSGHHLKAPQGIHVSHHEQSLGGYTEHSLAGYCSPPQYYIVLTNLGPQLPRE